MDFESAKVELAKALRSLEPVGEDGLEGLLRAILAEVTGQVFRISKSGHQRGVDVRSERANVIRIGLECKKYNPDTYLPLDELKSKLREAVEGDEPVDVWLLASTRAVPANNADELHNLGEALGVDVKVFDWQSAAGDLPALAVLCAAAPKTIAGRFPNDLGVAAALVQVRSHSLYRAQFAATVESLARPDVGYAPATSMMRKWIRDGLADNGMARTRLDGFNDIRSPGVKTVERPALMGALDDWWKSPKSPLALLGEEGHGKTWSALSWWAKRDEELADGLPLTVFLPSRRVKGNDPELVVAEKLADCTNIRDRDFWKRRIRIWLRRPTIRPQLIIVIDGLNQRWTDPSWSDFLQPLYTGRFKDRVAVIITSRPDAWRDLGSLQSLTPQPRTLSVTGFSDAELASFLALHGREIGDFAADMLPLLKVPRLALEAVESQNALADSGDVTPERLIYEDWLRRLQRRSDRLRIDHEEFHEFVRSLGRDLRSSIEDGGSLTRAEIVRRIGNDSGYTAADLAETTSEIVDGHWFIPGKRHHQFRLRKDLTAFALGLALAGELRESTDEGSATTTIAEAVDPFRGQDIGVAILRSATTASFLDPEVPAQARIALLRRWLSERNFRNEDFEAFWRILGFDKTTAFAVLERSWLDERRGAFEDEILIKGFSRAYQFSEMAESLRSRARVWLGWLWPDPDEGRFIGKHDPTTARARTNRTRTRERLAQWQQGPSKDADAPMLELRESGNVSWFAHRVVGILSLLPRAPFIPALKAWALSRSVMAVPRHFEEVAWLIRWNREDPDVVQAAVKTVANELAAKPDLISRQAAVWLLEATGAPESMAVAGAICESMAQGPNSPIELAEALERPAESDTIDPARAPTFQEVKTPANSSVVGADLWLYGDQVGEADFDFDNEKAKLARQAPGAIALRFRNAARSAKERSVEGKRGLARETKSLILVLGMDERTILRTAFADEIAKLNSGTSESDVTEKVFWRESKLLLDVWGLRADQQVVAVGNALRSGLLSADSKSVLERQINGSLSEILEQLPETESKQIADWLDCLGHIGAAEDLRTWSRLAELVLVADPNVRAKAMELAYAFGNDQAMTALAASGWSAAKTEHRSERICGSLALMELHRRVRIDRIEARVDNDAFASWVVADPQNPDALDAFAAFVERELQDAIVSKRRTYPRHWYRSMDRAMDALVTARTEWAVRLAESCLASSPDLPNSFLDDFPLPHLCLQLLHRAPQTGAKLWRGLLDAQRRASIRSHDIDFMPVCVPANAVLEAEKRHVILGATTDVELFAIVRAAQRSGQEDSLYDIVGEFVDSADPGVVARGMTLLAFADRSKVAERLWTRLDAQTSEGWLRHVYEHARFHYRRNRFARHWMEVYLTAADHDVALDAFTLTKLSVDERAADWVHDAIERFRKTTQATRLRYWNINAEIVNACFRQWSERFKKTLYFTRIPSRTQAPWI